MQFKIHPLNRQLECDLETLIEQKAKPVGALGLLEKLALRIGLIQQTTQPTLQQPTIVIFAGDHGATEEKISAYPSAVTAQMVLTMLAGKAAINVFGRQNGLTLKIVDAGVNYDFDKNSDLIHAKIAPGTRNYTQEPAMTHSQCEQALASGAAIVSQLHREGCNVIGFGEMGIGNTASASLLMSILCNLPLERCVGPGAGLDSDGVFWKLKVLRRARERGLMGKNNRDPITLLSEFGGFEIVMLCGAFLRAAELGMLVLIDGFIAGAALLAARAINPNVIDYCIACHHSAEPGHALMLQHLRARPLLDLGCRLGEGTGTALAYPLVRAAVGFLNEMASFDEAKVSGKSKTQWQDLVDSQDLADSVE